MANQSRLHYVILLISIAVLPFVVHITRIGENEAHRAGILGILILFIVPMIPKVIHDIPQSRRLLLYALAMWCAVVILSTVFSIHPLRSLLGDGERRMGLLTHMVLVAGAFLMWRVPSKQLWYFFWITSVIIAVQVILESQTLVGPNRIFGTERIYGLFGWTTFTGGWLALATLWAVLGFLQYGYAQSNWLQRSIVIASWGVIALGFILLGTRAASLSLFVGLFVAGLIWAILKGHRWLLFGCIGLTLLASSGVYVLSQIDWGDSALSQTSLFNRLDFQVFDPFRQEIWLDSQKIMIENPELINVDGTTDPYTGLRPILGYGAEAFEPPQRMINIGNLITVDNSLRADRAHNIWYDTFVMHGWLGVISIVSIYVSALYIALKQLDLLSRWIVIDTISGALISILFTWDTQFIPMGLTIGALGGLIVGIIQTGLTNKFDVDNFPTQSWLAFALLVAHIIEIQFGFITISTTWIPFLAIGLLLFEKTSDEQLMPLTPHWVWLAIAGTFIIRTQSDNIIFNIILLIAALVLVIPWTKLTVKQVVSVAILWGLSGANWLVLIPQATVIWDVALFVVMLWMFFGFQRSNITVHLNTFTVIGGMLIVLSIGIWAMDIVASTYKRQALQTIFVEEKVSAYNIAVRLRPYDDRMWFNAGVTNLEFGLQNSDGQAIGNSIFQLNQANNLHSYYGLYVNNLARLEANLAIGTSEFDTYAQLARQHYEISTRMWSQVGEFWREWARFEWEIMGDSQKALELIKTAFRLSPDDRETRNLRRKIKAEN